MSHPDNYDIEGKQNSTSIVFIHGAVLNRKMWLPQTTNLSRDYQTIAMDLPAHGSLLSQPFILDETLAYISALIKQNSKQKTLIVGSSLGGYIAIAFAQRYPEQCAGLVLSGSNLSTKGWLAVYLRTVRWILKRAFIQPWLKRRVVEQTRKAFPAGMEDVSNQVYALGLCDNMVLVFDLLLEQDWYHSISEYQGPILLLNGENDKINRRSESKFIKFAGQTTVQTIPGAGHAANIDQPEQFSRAIRAFSLSIGLEGASTSVDRASG